MFQDAEPAQVELVLSLNDGSPWTLTMSARTARIIGRYPRLPRLVVDGPLLNYRTPYPGS
ncbi:MAG TPA: hypothetical protein VF650_01020 [Allosphingosinicella sp.]|jgi:hypothetical protein